MEKTKTIYPRELFDLANQVAGLSVSLSQIIQRGSLKIKIDRTASIIVSEDAMRVFDLTVLNLDKTLEILEALEKSVNGETKERERVGKI